MSNTTASSHSFIYGRPVKPNEFLGRKDTLRTIFNRLRNGESTAIVGEPKIGKTSLLIKLENEATQQHHLGDDARNIVVCRLDLQPIDHVYMPVDFWSEVLEPLHERPGHATISRKLKQAVQAGYTRRSLERLFNLLGQRGRRLVLLLDEFEHLLNHPNFQSPAFFALLRSLATLTGGLVLIPTSRLSVAQMNKSGAGSLKTGSPFLNNVIEIRLRPFSTTTTHALLDWAEEAFSSQDQQFIYRVAGHHPYLLQAMAAVLMETSDDNRYARAAEQFYEWVSFYFDDLWRMLDDQARDTALILSLMELNNRTLGQNLNEIDQVNAFGAHLRNLAKLGLAERVGENWFNQQHLCSWRGEQWAVRPQSLVWWIRNMIVAKTSSATGVDTAQEQTTPEQRHSLRRILVTYYNQEELDTLCFDLSIEYDDLPGEGKAGKARELITHLARRSRIHELIKIGKQQRPDASWIDLVETSTSQPPTCNEWVTDERYHRIWTGEQWTQLISAVCNAPEWTPYDISG